MLLLLVPGAFGQIDDGWSQASRTVTGTWDADGFSFTSVRDATPQDAFTVAFDRNDATVSWSHNASRLEASMRWRGLVEFQDLDQDGSFSLGDPIIEQTLIEDLQAQRVRVQELPGGRYEVTTTYRHDTPPFGTVTLVWHIVPTYAASEGPLQAPMTVALDVRIDNHPFATDNQTRLALEMRWSQAMGGEGDTLVASVDDTRLRQSWGAADIDDAIVAPGVTSHRYGSGELQQEVLLLNWPRADRIEQPMEFAWQRIEPEPPLPEVILSDLAGRWYLYLLGLGLTALLVYLPIRIREAT